MFKNISYLAILIVLNGLFSSQSKATSDKAVSADDVKQLIQIVKAQQAQINRLEKRVDQLSQQLQSTDEMVEATVEAVESDLVTANQSDTQIGGYGELHYTQEQDQQELDFHRFVLFVGHDFNDSIRFYSELEVEHAVAEDGQVGAVELEQAFVEIALSDNSRLKTGLFLMPIGILSETHEPTSFYGVERNNVETNIIPTTWSEAGAMLSTEIFPGLNLDFAIHSGLQVPLTGNQSFLPRMGRQKGAKANAASLAYTGRIKFTSIPGLQLAASYQFQEDISQTLDPAPATLWSAHIAYQKNQFKLRALYAQWDIDNSGAKLVGRDQQFGYYFEPSYQLNQDFGLFIRWSQWDNNAGNNINTAIKQTNLGLNYWPTEDVVFKIDYQDKKGAENDQAINLGMGYQF